MEANVKAYDCGASGKRVLIVGAGGFIGGFIAKESLSRGYETWVAVRGTTSRRWLDDERLHFVVLDWDELEDDMGARLRGALPEGERWDYVVYNLGATKCGNFADFNRINYMYLRVFTGALRAAGMMPERLLFMSSLSALGPGDERGYAPLTEGMIPNPNTRYGLSKIKAETFLETCTDVPWTIFRPTGVYGPHEQDYLMMIKCIDRGFDFGVGMRKQLLTFIYVKDLARAIFDALGSGKTLRRKYNIAEGRAYSQGEFRRIVARALGRRVVVPVRLPMWAVYVASVVSEKYGLARLRPTTLNRDKFKIMRQRNWDCDTSRAREDFGFVAEYSLEQGIAETVAAYKEEKEGGKR